MKKTSVKKTGSKTIPEKSIKSTSDRLLESMTPKERQRHEQEYQELLLSELLIAITNQKELSVRKLAKAANVSPTIIQPMRSGENKDYSLTVFLKVLKGLGCKRFKVEYHGKNLSIPIPTFTKK